mmetsp:Transcript_34242/g.89419  ORF Transcript_34242/g.89419 Transcript_34242/m.89419 type:complete len:172 (+) Transcript_34242:22-537(+)
MLADPRDEKISELLLVLVKLQDAGVDEVLHASRDLAQGVPVETPPPDLTGVVWRTVPVDPRATPPSAASRPAIASPFVVSREIIPMDPRFASPMPVIVPTPVPQVVPAFAHPPVVWAGTPPVPGHGPPATWGADRPPARRRRRQADSDSDDERPKTRRQQLLQKVGSSGWW